jgi:cobalamin biosynthesis Mg chelatase CobN
MLRHPGHAAQQVEARLARLLCLGRGVGLPAGLWERIAAVLVEDEPTFARLQADHPPAAAEVARRLLEAADLGLWRPEPAGRALLVKRAALA